eukprot:TRINITY_DN1515_c2_g1_i2.p1 TRINITY_DN1515_c2_g1~~TRINITY_DN1515_c2_g1_i2.p1  ORF type:complete len:307 (+),score=83.56 TRINITY_DN1515_c2_g1_i2:131-1051(+)
MSEVVKRLEKGKEKELPHFHIDMDQVTGFEIEGLHDERIPSLFSLALMTTVELLDERDVREWAQTNSVVLTQRARELLLMFSRTKFQNMMKLTYVTIITNEFESLDLNGFPHKMGGFRQIFNHRFPSLMELDVSRSGIDGTGLELIGLFCPQLKKLNLAKCSRVVAVDFKHLVPQIFDKVWEGDEEEDEKAEMMDLGIFDRIQLVMKSLKKGCPNLEHVNLEGCRESMVDSCLDIHREFLASGLMVKDDIHFYVDDRMCSEKLKETVRTNAFWTALKSDEDWERIHDQQYFDMRLKRAKEVAKFYE